MFVISTGTLVFAGTARAAGKTLVLATTTSTQDSGLLDVLVSVFEERTGIFVKTIAVGSGHAMALGARGEADVLLVHSPEDEMIFMSQGNGIDRRLVMHNDFIIVGPPSDPAGIRGSKTAKEAFKRIAQRGSLFVSRSDNSGTHKKEMAIWKAAGIAPEGRSFYQEAGLGMGQTLMVASEKGAYTLADRGTFMALRKNLALGILVEGCAGLLNVYHVIRVNPERHPRVNAAGAISFADFLVSKEAQGIIARFGIDKYGSALFFPDAGKPEPE